MTFGYSAIAYIRMSHGFFYEKISAHGELTMMVLKLRQG